MATVTINGESREIDDSTLEYILKLGHRQHATDAPFEGNFWSVLDTVHKFLAWMRERND